MSAEEEEKKEAERKAEEDRISRIAELAPDREKLKAFADKIDAVLSDLPVITCDVLYSCLGEHLSIIDERIEYIRGM